MDPFFAECRAFGHIIEAGLNSKFTIFCYGYLAVSAQVQEELEKEFGISEWDCPVREYIQSISKRQMFRAIIKNLMPTGVSLEEKLVTKLLRDPTIMRRLEIYPMDFQIRNYMAGSLINMSIAITEPHYLFFVSTPKRARDYEKKHLAYSNHMVKELEFEKRANVEASETYRTKLRSGKPLAKGGDKVLESGLNPPKQAVKSVTSTASKVSRARRRKATVLTP
ncbi:hypothetical protein MMC21_000012 [Puttea exsequens]|nr:hypothetical protein [Puttea exsequens]